MHKKKATDKAIRLIIKNCSIIVNDVNYSSLHDNSIKLRFVYLSACYNDAQVTRISCEYKRHLHKKEQILTHLAYACTSFDDILPIEVIQPPANPTDLSTSILRYIGNMPPVTRLEQLDSFVC
jgi:hypothetical protein